MTRPAMLASLVSSDRRALRTSNILPCWPPNLSMKGASLRLSRDFRQIFWRIGGTITLAVMETLTIENGLITVWRDYFDPGDFDRQLAAL
ncbi:hypothetical protein [Rhizobium sp. AN80A]|uniref:hypothetical protein n=1 Tax=Rhizobium sp. AN80A TaxID=3040673 RepID=UPI0024B323EA|nr:hypothetical protein [Rhizobium sp. AN80A]